VFAAAVVVAAALVALGASAAGATAAGPGAVTGPVPGQPVHVARPSLWAGTLHAVLRTEGERFHGAMSRPTPGAARVSLFATGLFALAAATAQRSDLVLLRPAPRRAPPRRHQGAGLRAPPLSSVSATP
jgi:hypothetical protein